MADRLGSYDFVYVHSDIPAGVTIREWRAQRAASRRSAVPQPRLAAVRRRLDSAARMRHATARALARPRIAGVRGAPRPAASPRGATGLRYEAEAADDAAAAVTELQDQFDDLVAIVDALAERLDAPQRRP